MSGDATSPTTFWREASPLVLASKSSARAALLTQTGIPFVTQAADIDERAVEAPLRASSANAAAIAEHLARAKAAFIAAQNRDQLVLGADQTLALDGRMFTKPASRDDALAQLRELSGRVHHLHSAICVARGDDILFETTRTARLHMRPLSEAFLHAYAEAAAPALTASVGAYQIEGVGIHLFDAVDGDHSTILGLPIVPLLAFLRERGSVLG